MRYAFSKKPGNASRILIAGIVRKAEMKQHSDIPCWITLAHLPRRTADRVNRLTLSILHEHGMTLEAFFGLDYHDRRKRLSKRQSS